MTTTFRLRLLAACLVLVGLAFVQDPGFLVPDTKLDLAVAPGDLLARALHLWDGEGAFGQLQNQAYGYLWPMGPFFALGSVLGLPGWVVQRLWVGLVMAVAMTGAARLGRALGVRSDLACLVVGFAFALSPRMLTTLGPISIEAWPSAVAPWVLLPLVLGSRTGSARRAAAWSAAAVAMVGGVNAAATFAVIPLGALWLLTRTPGPRRRSLMLWWPAFTLLGTLWWLVPLVVLGAYSPPFLDFIETAAVTTFPTTPFDVLRGTSNWVPYVSADARAGNDLLTTSFLVLNGGTVLLLGLAGLLDRRTPHRTFLACGVLLGVLMVGAGHVGATSGWFAGDLRDLLDGPLAPLRNVHKFDVVLRLPLVLGLGFLLDRVVARPDPSSAAPAERAERPQRAQQVNRVAVVGMVLLVVAGSVVPALQGRIPPRGATVGVPAYWEQAAAWLDDHSEGGTDLLVPGSAFGDYVWGQPRDEPMQWLAGSRWAVRNIVPLAPPGNIRMLDEVESALVEGTGSPGLLAFLQRAGVQHLVVRNDLTSTDDVPDPVVVHAALAQTPGLRRVASFGPQVGGETRLETADGDPLLVNGGWQAFYPAVEVYEVPAAPAAVLGRAPTVVAGGPEDLRDLLDLGVLDDGPTVLAADVTPDYPDPRSSDLVLTDGLRARERAFGRLHDAASPVRAPGDARRTTGPEPDHEVGGATSDLPWRTTARFEGARGVSASSAASDAGAVGGSRRGNLPFAALDRADDTEWVTALLDDDPAWWQVDLEGRLDVDATVTADLVGGASASPEQVVRVRTAAGASIPVPLGPLQRARVPLPAGPTSWVRVEEASGVRGRSAALADVAVSGVDVRRRLVLPSLPPAWGSPDRIVLRRDAEDRSGCVTVLSPGGEDVRCVVGRERADEEAGATRRAFTLPEATRYAVEGSVDPQGGRALNRLLLADQPVDILGSSRGVPDPRASAIAAVDGDPGTTWLADPADTEPTLSVSWIGQRRVGRIEVDVDTDAGARTPTRLLLRSPQGTRRVGLVDGIARFSPLVTDRLDVQVEADDQAVGLGFDTRAIALPVGISELRIGGVEYLPLGLSADTRTYPCGTGPVVEIDGRLRRTGVVASPAELARGAAVPAPVCGPGLVDGFGFGAGGHTVDVVSTRAFALHSLVLGRSSGPAGSVGGASIAADLAVGPGTRTVDEGSTAPAEAPDDLVVLRQNTNPGWVARQGDAALVPVVVDGWQQAWRLREPLGDVQVEARFTPDRTYRLGLLVGLTALGVLALALLAGSRRRSYAARPAALEDRDLSVVGGSVVSVVAAGLLAGGVGAVVAAVTVVVVVGLRTVVSRAARAGSPGGRSGWRRRSRATSCSRHRSPWRHWPMPSGPGEGRRAGPAPWPGPPTCSWCRWRRCSWSVPRGRRLGDAARARCLAGAGPVAPRGGRRAPPRRG